MRIAMLSSVLHSERAVQVNIVIMRAFVQLRAMLATPIPGKRQIGFHASNEAVRVAPR
jgi:hypothetical protein